MTFTLEVAEDLDKLLSKLARRDKPIFEAIEKKIPGILENPLHFKPLRAPMQNKRRVHITGQFILVFSVDQERNIVKLLEFEHRDMAYK